MLNYKNGYHFSKLEAETFPNFAVTDEELATALNYLLNDQVIIRHTDNTGKSGLNVSSLLMEPQKLPEFEHFSTISNSIKKDIIICNPLLKLRALEPGDAAFLFSLLRTRHNIYIWQGDNTPFSQLKPVTSSQELYDALKKKMQPQKASEVEKALALDGKSLEEVIILDFNRYGEILSKLPPFIAKYSVCPTPHSLDLSEVFIKKDEIDFLNQTIETLDHITLGYHTLEECLHICEVFKGIKSLHLSEIQMFFHKFLSKKMYFQPSKKFFTNLQKLESLSFENRNDESYTALLVSFLEDLHKKNIISPSLKSISIYDLFVTNTIVNSLYSLKLSHISIETNNYIFFLDQPFNKSIESLKFKDFFIEFHPGKEKKIKTLTSGSISFCIDLESKNWIAKNLKSSKETLKSLNIPMSEDFIVYFKEKSEESLVLDFSEYHSLTKLKLWDSFQRLVIKLPDNLKSLNLSHFKNVIIKGNLKQLEELILTDIIEPITYTGEFGHALRHLELTRVKVDNALLNLNVNQLEYFSATLCDFSNKISINAGNLRTLILINNKITKNKKLTYTSTQNPTLQFNDDNIMLPGNITTLDLADDDSQKLDFLQLNKLEKLTLDCLNVQSVIFPNPAKIKALQICNLGSPVFQAENKNHFQIPELECLSTFGQCIELINKDASKSLRYLALGDIKADIDITRNYNLLEFLLNEEEFLIKQNTLHSTSGTLNFNNLRGLKINCLTQETKHLHENIITPLCPVLESFFVEYENNFTDVPVLMPLPASVKRCHVIAPTELPQLHCQPLPYLAFRAHGEQKQFQEMADALGPMVINNTFYAPHNPSEYSTDDEDNLNNEESQNLNLGDFVGGFSTSTMLGKIGIAGSKRNIQIKRPLKAVMFDSLGNLIPVDKFRHFVFNKFERNAITGDLDIRVHNTGFLAYTDLEFVPRLDKAFKDNLIKKKQAENSEQNHVIIEGTVYGSEWVPLPTLASTDVIETVYLEKNSNPIALYYNKDTKAWFVGLPGNQGKGTLKMLYSFRTTPNLKPKIFYKLQGEMRIKILQNSTFTDINKASSEALLPESFNQELANLIEKYEKLHFLKNTDINNQSKIDQLAEFCRNLSHESGKEEVPENITGLINVFDCILREEKGAACLQRTLIMALFARHIGIDALPILNMSHARTEINDKIYDLGGAPAEYDVEGAKKFLDEFFTTHSNKNRSKTTVNPPKTLLPEEIQENKKIKLEEDDVSENENSTFTNSPKTLLPEEIQENKKIKLEKGNVSENASTLKQSKYYYFFQEKIGVKHFKSASELLQTQHPVLLQICRGQDAFTLNSALSDAYEGEYLYVDHTKDLKKLLTSLHFDSKGKFIKRKPGLLAQFVKKKRGLLVLNFSTMSAREKSIYKNIVDDPPTLDGERISLGIQVVLLINEDDKISQDVSTRCQLASLTLTSDETNTQSAMDHEPHPSSEPIIVDCLNSDNDWEEYLFGPIQLDGQHAYWPNSPLLTAINTHKSLQILNPPTGNRAFDLFLYRAQKYKTAMIYGVPYKLPDDFHINLQTRPFKETPKNVTFKQSLPIQPKYFLNVPNHKEYLTELRVNNDSQRIKTLEGFFSQIDEQDIILINDSLPKDIWQKLMLHIQCHYPDKRFQFALLPGCHIEGLNLEPLNELSDEIQRKGAVIGSNDIDFCAEQFQNDNPHAKIIPLCKNTKITDLLYKISHTQSSSVSDTSIIQFQHQTMSVLELLRKGQSVVLVINDLNPNLYVELQPLLCPEPMLYINGTWEKLPGQLSIITTPQSTKHCRILHPLQKNYAWQDYLNTLPVEEWPLYQNIKQFLEIASKIPHVGKNMPENVRINFSRIKKLAEASKNNKTAKNPLRTVFHLEYDPETEIYTYLSVIAKLLFYSPNKSTEFYQSVNQAKLNSLGPDSSLWQKLNCLHPLKLRELFGTYENLTTQLTSASLPQFNQKSRKELEQYFEGYQKNLEPLVANSVIKTKAYSRLIEAVNSGKQHIHLQGESGVGKTTLVHELAQQLNIKLYEGPEALSKFLEPSDEKKIFLLDEINLSENGSHDHLKSLPPNCIVISTGNPSHYPNRHRQDIIQDYFCTIQVKSFTVEETKALVLKPILEPEKLYDDTVAELLIEVCEIMRKLNPYHMITLRDQENLAQRYIYLCKHNAIDNNNNNSSIDQKAALLFKTIISEFLFGIAEELQREKFIDSVKNCIGNRYPCLPDDCFKKILHPQEHPLPNCSIVITPDRYLYFDVLKQDIECLALKSGILVEGESGTGKSTDFIEVLKALQREMHAQVTVGTPSYLELIKQAVHNGKSIILDELDLFDPQESKQIELFLNTILSNKQINRQSSALLTFIILASQNGSSQQYQGRNTVSKAITNRMHKLIKNDYSRDELVFIANTLKIENACEFVDAFLLFRKEHAFCNSRSFFKAIKEISLLESKCSVNPLIN